MTSHLRQGCGGQVRRDPSLRAQARAQYQAAASAASKSAEALAQADKPTLTERVRALYEDSIVPVRDIAALVGVTERTIYKYARKGGWRQRHLCLARAAGGRFIPRADQDKPHAQGLKALDPEGAQRAAQACDRAEALSAQALAQAASAAFSRAARAQAEKNMAAQLRALDLLTGALLDLAKTENAVSGRPSARLGRRLQAAIFHQLAASYQMRVPPH
jgi:hypothetical protein